MTDQDTPGGSADPSAADDAAPGTGEDHVTTADPVLAATLAAHGATPVGERGVYRTEAGQTAVTEELLHGRVITHRVSADELVAGQLDVVPDLAPLVSFAQQWPVDGGAVRFDADARRPGQQVASGPQGWLDTLRAGAMLAITVGGEGLQFALIDPPPLDAQLVEALVATSGTVPADQFWVDALIRRDDLLRTAIAPLGDHLAAAGRRAEGNELLVADAAAGRPDPSPLERLTALLAHVGQGDAVDDATVAAAFADPDVVADFIEQALGAPEVDVASVEVLVAAAERGGAPVAGVRFVQARLAEQRGDHAEVERFLHDALVADRSYAAASIDAAWYASDLGDAGRAFTLLLAAGVETDDPELRLLQRYSRPGPLRAKRNDDCPCGSGKRYKKCHLERNGYDIGSRIEWIARKVRTFGERPSQRAGLWQTAMAFAGVDGAFDDPDRLIAAASDPLVLDFLLFDGLTIGRFLDARRDLLPADEVAVLEQWQDARHGVYRRVVTDDDAGIEVDGEIVPLAAGHDADHWLAVVVPTPEGPRIAGNPTPVPTSAVDALTEAAGLDRIALATAAGRHLGFSATFES